MEYLCCCVYYQYHVIQLLFHVITMALQLAFRRRRSWDLLIALFMVGKLGPVWPMSLIAYSTKSYKHNDSHRNHQHYIIHQATNNSLFISTYQVRVLGNVLLNV